VLLQLAEPFPSSDSCINKECQSTDITLNVLFWATVLIITISWWVPRLQQLSNN